MRIRIEIEADALDIFYRHSVLSLIKGIISASDKEYKKQFYSVQGPKPFTFSVFFKNFSVKHNQTIFISKKYDVKDNVFILNDKRFFLNFSTSDKELYEHILDGISKKDRYVINKQVFTVKNFKSIYSLGEFSSYTFFKTASPIIVSKKHINSLSSYASELMNKKLKTLRGYGLQDGLKVIILDVDTKKIKHTFRGIRDHFHTPFIYLNALSGRFVLKGHPEDLKYIYDTGFLSRTSQGFGMINIDKNIIN